MMPADGEAQRLIETPVVRTRPELVPPPPNVAPGHDTVPCPPPAFDCEITEQVEGMVGDLARCLARPSGS